MLGDRSPGEPVTLRELIEQALQGMRVATDVALTAQKTAMETALTAQKAAVDQAALSHAREHALTQLALTKAEESSVARFENVNEWRAALNDVIAKCLTRVESDAHFATMSAVNVSNHEAVTRRIEDLARSSSKATDDLGHSTDTRLKAIETSLAETRGQAAQAANNQRTQLWAVGIGVSLLSVVVAIAMRVLS